MTEKTLLNNHRKILWNEAEKCQQSMDFVKSLFQNEMPLNAELVDEWAKEVESIVITLKTLKTTMQCWIQD